MQDSIFDRFKRSIWNVFSNRDPTFEYDNSSGPVYFTRPDRATTIFHSSDHAIIAKMINRIAVDVSAVSIKHVILDGQDRYKETVKDCLNTCLTLSANEDQTGRAFIQDAIESLLDEGLIAIVPVDATEDPGDTDSFDIGSLRTGKVTKWFPKHVTVELYNIKTGLHEEVTVPKRTTAIIQNPFYTVMNEPNSTAKRLTRKLALLDSIDEQSGAGKLDLIIQLPYSLKSDRQKDRANERIRKIEDQLMNHKYGIAYIDATEHVTQLNRSVDNNLMKQVEYLTSQLYGEFGMSQSVFDGTADEKTMLNYRNRAIEPLLSAFVDELTRKFISQTARARGHAVRYFTEPFKLVPVDQIAEIADKFTRNEIMTSNEIRQAIGMIPAKDPKADMLRNSNISEAKDANQIDVNGNNIKNENVQVNNSKSSKLDRFKELLNQE